MSSSEWASETKRHSNWRGRDVDPALEQVAEERAVPLGVARLRVLERAHGAVAEEQRRHRADALDAAERGEPRLEPGAFGLQLLVDISVAQPAEHGCPRRRRERVPGERAGLVDLAGRSEPLHHVGAAAERGRREAAADDLAEDRQVGQDAEALLGAAAGDAEAGDHLVEDQQCARRVAERAQRLEEPGRGRHDAHVPGHRLDDDRGEPFAVALDRGGGRVEVVVGRDDGVGRRRRRDAGARRDAERRQAGARARRAGRRRGRGSSRRT